MNIQNRLKVNIFKTSKILKEVNSRLTQRKLNPIRKGKKTANDVLRSLCLELKEDFKQELPKNLARRSIAYWNANISESITTCIGLAIEDYLYLSGESNKNAGLAVTEYQQEHLDVILGLPSNKFYSSPEWERLRYKILRDRGRVCECCGSKPNKGIEIHVDHIKPRSIYPELSLSENNLQILCGPCNRGKSNVFEDDWR